MSMHLCLELSQPLLPRLQVTLQAHDVLRRKQPVPCTVSVSKFVTEQVQCLC